MPVLEATLVRVVDGDTVHVELASGPLKLRLHGIDAPEGGQVGSDAATKALRSFLAGEPLEIEPVEQTDGYGRMVAKVFARGDDVNARMIATGYAWAERRYLRRGTADERYCELEGLAREQGRGLWAADPATWEPPWEWRWRRDGRAVPAANWATETAARCLAAIGRRGGPTAEPAMAEGNGDCRIKGNINRRGERIYHAPGSASYDDARIETSRGERWFCSTAEAEAAGWRAPRN
jgi:endonuclease YncB( thermonuclease family)